MMRAVFPWVAGIVGVMILAFNPHIVTSVYNTAVSPIEKWRDNPNDVKGASKILIKSPKFPSSDGKTVPAAKTMREDLAPKAKPKGSGDGGAVAVQRAKGL